MSFWDRKPFVFQLLISALSIIVLWLSFTNLIILSTTPTGENTYQELNSQLFLRNDIVAKKYKTGISPDKIDEIDTITKGCLILKINDSTASDINTLYGILNKYQNNQYFKLNCLVLNDGISRKNYWVDKNDINMAAISELNSAAIVIHIVKDGVADRAGLKIGDIILRVNGQKFEMKEANDILRHQRSGSKLMYQVLRNGELIDIEIILTKYGVAFSFLMMFISGILIIALGAFFAIKRPQLKAARITSLFLISLGTLLAFGMVVNYGSDTHLTFIQSIMMFWGISMGLPLLFHSQCYFPYENTSFTKNKLYIYIMYSIAILSLVYFSFLFIGGLNQYFDLDIFSYFIAAEFVYFGIIQIIKRRSLSTEQRKISRLIRWTYYLIFVMIASLFVLRELGYETIREYVFTLAILIPISYIITVIRYRLLDISIKIKRNYQYLFISSVWKIIIFAVLVLSIWFLATLEIELPNIRFTGKNLEVLEKPLDPVLKEISSKVIVALIALIFAALLAQISRRVQDLLDTKFYRVKFDYKLASSEITQMMQTTLNLNELAQGIVEKLSELIHLKRVGVVFFRSNKVSAQEYHGFKDASLREFCLFAGSDLLKTIDQFIGGFRIDYLPTTQKNVFKECKFQYIVPIRSKGKVLGAFFIGEKLSEAAITNHDLEFLSSISSQASVSVENAFLYDQIAQQERIKHELEIARKIQLASLPNDNPELQGMDISGITYPAMEVGGDFYDFLPGKDNELTIVVGDVSGKGTSAALYMSKAQGIMRTLNEFHLQPKELFVRTNQLLYKYLERSSFITAIAAKFNPVESTIDLTRAGHLPLFAYDSKKNEVIVHKPQGVVLGMTKKTMFERNMQEMKIDFNNNDVFLFVTDGVIEARNKNGEEFGDERLKELLMKIKNSDASTIRELVVKSVRDFAGSEKQFDDLTVVVAKSN